ncbi:hypothetical protein Tco_1184801 [Tanacetum coccineum]
MRYFKGVSLVVDEAALSLLQYADDAFVFDESLRLNASNLILVLKCFEEASCLKVNLSKSKLYGIGIDNDEVVDVASSLFDALWRKVVKSFYGFSGGFSFSSVRNIRHGLGDFLREIELWMTSRLLFPQLAVFLYLLMVLTNGLGLVMIQGVWKWRNKMVNASLDSVVAAKDEDVFPSIQRLSNIWISACCSSSHLDWRSWISSSKRLFAKC